nr:pol polyprotein [Nuttalliella namaqua]
MSSAFFKQLRKVSFSVSADRPLFTSAFNGVASPVAVCTARVILAGLCYPVEFHVLRTCCRDVILGCNFLQQNKAVIDYVNHEISLSGDPSYEASVLVSPSKLAVLYDTILPPRATLFVTLRVSDIILSDILVTPKKDVLASKGLVAPFCIATVNNSNETLIALSNTLLEPVMLPAGYVVALAEHYQDLTAALSVHHALDKSQSTPIDGAILDVMVSKELTSDCRQSLFSLLQEYASLFDACRCPLGVARNVEHRIDTGGVRPLRQRPYRVSHSERETIETEVTEMLSKSIVRPSSSPWSSPVVLVPKKDGSIRFCVDYRRLNKVTRKDVYPMPRIDDALDAVCGANYFSSLDMRSGYWQIPMAEEDKEKTAFVTPDGLYEFNVMPFGLCNAPATFERMMDTVLRGLRWKVCLCYLDDVVVYSSSFSEHLQRLSFVLAAFRQAGLQLNHKKCHFGYQQLKILGHVVSPKGVTPDPEKVRAVVDFPKPRTTKELRSFLGLCSYFRRFIKNFASIASPLTTLSSDTTPFVMDKSCDEAFATLKSLLASCPVLQHFDPSATPELHTDASGTGLGAVLTQRRASDPMEHVVAYASRRLTKAEQNYSITEKECLAVVWSVGKFRPYLFGRPFVVVTDHHALCWLSSLKDPSGRLGRWALRLQEFHISVYYKSGRRHRDADALSRCSLPEDDPNSTLSLDEVLALTPYNSETFLADQLKDPFAAALINQLNGSSSSTNKKFLRQARHYVLSDNILYKKNYCPDGSRLLLVIPAHLKNEVLRSLHDDPTSGHLGFYKTYDRVRRRFFWPRQYSSVHKYVVSCPACQKRKPCPSPPAGQLQPLEPPRQPFERVGIDLFGPLPKSRSGNCWVIVVIDHLTRYVITGPLPSSTAADVAQFFIHQVLLRHGAPRVMISDRGRQFLSELLKEVLAACSVTHRFTSPYHPQTNGLTERFNHTLADMLSFYISSEHTNWDELLPYVTFAYNTAVQSTTHYSPFFLLFGCEPSHTIDTLFPYPANSDNPFLSDATCRTEECRQIARFRTFDTQQKSKTRYDEGRRVIAYRSGDLVWLWVPTRKQGLSEKLLCHYIGPYKVLRALSPTTYMVQPLQPPTDRRHRGTESAHVSRLKPYVPPVQNS